MSKMVEGLKSAFVLTSGTVLGGMSGVLYLLFNGLKCLNIDVPNVKPTVDVNLNFSSVNLTGVLKLDIAGGLFSSDPINAVLDQDKLFDALSKTQVQINTSVPDIVPEIQFNPCIPPLYIGAAAAFGATAIGLTTYYLIKCRQNRDKDVDSVELEEVSPDVSEDSYSDRNLLNA